MQAYFKQMLEYDYVSNLTILELLKKRDAGNQRPVELLSHILSAQKIWLDRIQHQPQSVERFMDRNLDAIKADLDLYHQQWLQWLSSTRIDFNSVLHYKNIAGQPFSNKLVDIVAHVFNHGTHHRGQIGVMLKDEGFTLPVMDYIAYVR